jgi:sterol desaturase/sphingolipid hydroxylase (fatty acid hydroxylase superfamily)
MPLPLTAVFMAFVSIGVASQVIAHFSPVVRQEEEPEYFWDLIGLASTLVFTGLATVYIVEPIRGWLEDTNFLVGWYAAMQSKPIWLLLLINLILADFIAYWGHRVLHTRQLWSTHAWHHSVKILNWVSGMRASPLHTIIIIALPLLLSSTAVPLPHASMAPLMSAIFSIFIQHSLHSNIRVPFAKQIEWLLITPRYHRVHHSAHKHHTDSNFGFVFPLWDRLFFTYSDPQEVPVDEPLGLDYEFNKTLALVGLPARKGELLEDFR